MKSGVLKYLFVVGVVGANAVGRHISMVKTYAEITPEFTEKYLTEERRVIEYGKEINEASVLKNDNVEYLGFKGNDKYKNLQYELTSKKIFGKSVTKKVVVPFMVEDTMALFITLRENEIEPLSVFTKFIYLKFIEVYFVFVYAGIRLLTRKLSGLFDICRQVKPNAKISISLTSIYI